MVLAHSVRLYNAKTFSGTRASISESTQRTLTKFSVLIPSMRLYNTLGSKWKYLSFNSYIGVTERRPVIKLTRSTADAVERPSPVNLLRAAVTGIGENTQI